jgi:N-acetylglucosamine-6-sulfatase
VIHAKTRAALKRVKNKDDPFFLWVAPMAPHGQFNISSDGSISTHPPIPAARHAHLFRDVKSKFLSKPASKRLPSYLLTFLPCIYLVPRTPHFNPDKQVKTASYWKNLEKLNATLVEEFDEAYRNRLRALQAVDEIVGTIFDELEKSGELDNTFIFYSADNG